MNMISDQLVPPVGSIDECPLNVVVMQCALMAQIGALISHQQLS